VICILLDVVFVVFWKKIPAEKYNEDKKNSPHTEEIAH